MASVRLCEVSFGLPILPALLRLVIVLKLAVFLFSSLPLNASISYKTIILWKGAYVVHS